MSCPDRTELFQALADLAERHPHWRFGQLVSNIAGWADIALWDIEDGRFAEEAREHLGTLAAREEASEFPDVGPIPASAGIGNR